MQDSKFLKLRHSGELSGIFGLKLFSSSLHTFEKPMWAATVLVACLDIFTTS